MSNISKAILGIALAGILGGGGTYAGFTIAENNKLKNDYAKLNNQYEIVQKNYEKQQTILDEQNIKIIKLQKLIKEIQEQGQEQKQDAYFNLIESKRCLWINSNILDDYLKEYERDESFTYVEYLTYDSEKFKELLNGSDSIDFCINQARHSIDTNISGLEEDILYNITSLADSISNDKYYSLNNKKLIYNFVDSNGNSFDFTNCVDGDRIVYRSLTFDIDDSNQVCVNILVDYVFQNHNNFGDSFRNNSFEVSFNSDTLALFIREISSNTSELFYLVSVTDDQIIARNKVDDSELVVLINNDYQLGINRLLFDYKDEHCIVYNLTYPEKTNYATFVNGNISIKMQASTQIVVNDNFYNITNFDDEYCYFKNLDDSNDLIKLKFSKDDSGNEIIIYNDSTFTKQTS